jgi:hypothetical protein
MSAQSVLQLCKEIKPQIGPLAQKYGLGGRNSQWANVQRNVNSKCDRAQILKRRNNNNSRVELAAAQEYLRDTVLPGIRKYNANANEAVANAALAINAANTANAAAMNANAAAVNAINSVPNVNSSKNNNGLVLGGRRKKTRKSGRKTRKTRRSRK